MASSSSTSTTKLQRKHHVFLSFKGEDTRVCFTSHLHAALERKNLLTFIDDDLKRGEKISDSLVKAIEDSMLSVIIFSERYASSRWCLHELVKILECRNRGQIAIPIFYKVDPSHVRNQSGSFGDAFAELVKRKALEVEEERRFRAALNETANISGHDSRNMVSESKFIEKIVKDILNKISKMISCHPMNLVGIAERIREIESVLEMESQEVRILGIWGMGGIGKTTIAGAVYNKICTEFEAFLFVPNIREELKRCTVVDLQRRFVSRLLDREISDMGPLSFGNHLIRDGLRRKKVLIVFDDVDSSMPLQELLLGQHDSFGPGSRILVTSRDRHVLEQVVDATYGVHALNHSESLKLLKSKAFNKIDPTSDYKDLLDRTVNYAKGNPLALVVLGSTLCDRSKEDWYSKLNGLGQGQDDDILNVLRISYDGLNKEEKKAFLDIACFFRGMDRYRVTPILEKKSSSVHFCISNLIYKSLLTTFDNMLGNRLWMHDLLQEMACSIVRGESENPGKRSRLFDPEDIYYVLEENEGTEAVKGILLDMDEPREMLLKSDAFVRMRCLEFLIIKGKTSKVKLPDGGFEYLPEKLRYFRWDGYSSRSLSQTFCAANLVDFDFPKSKVEYLWSGRQELVNLRRINLRYSHLLTKLPDLSKAKKLQKVYLDECASLIEVPSYFQYFEDLEVLSLCDCYNLQSLPRKINSNNIKVFSLSGCLNIKKSPEISANITYLYLCRTAIEELQQSFGGKYTSLDTESWHVGFDPEGCHSLLVLEGCSNITRFPTISGNIGSLSLGEIAIEEVPSSIQFLTSLRSLSLNNCKKLSRLSDSICKLKSLKYLDISGCSKLESFPQINKPMPSLKHLNLSGTAITKLPSSIQFLINLRFLGLTNCKKLSSLPNSICELKSLETLRLSGTAIRELPKLPPSLKRLSAYGCESLEIISGSTVGGSKGALCFANCFKLDQKALMGDLQFGKIANSFGMVLPGSEIPQWFRYQSRGSNSITVQFPSNTPNLKAIAFCSVVLYPHNAPVDIYGGHWCWGAKITGIRGVTHIYDSGLSLEISESYHMYLSYHNIMKSNHGMPNAFRIKYVDQEVRFELRERVKNRGMERVDRRKPRQPVKVKMCGVHLIYENPDF